MNEEVVDLFHEVIDATIIVIPNPREEIVHGFLQGVFEVRSKASLRANRPQGARLRIKTNETVGSHQQVPVPTGTCGSLHLAVSQAEILLRVLEERLDAPGDTMIILGTVVFGYDMIKKRFTLRPVTTPDEVPDPGTIPDRVMVEDDD